jgi:hypothetical protein
VVVPEAAVNLEDRSFSWHDDIRGAGKRLVVEAIAQALGMERPAEKKLRARIPTSDAGHVPPPLLGAVRVGPGRPASAQGWGVVIAHDLQTHKIRHRTGEARAEASLTRDVTQVP